MEQTNKHSVIKELREAIRPAEGQTILILEEHALQQFSADASGRNDGVASALVKPGSTKEVQAVVRVAARHGIAVVAQGSRTSLAGAASAVNGAILLDLSRMNRILRIDKLEQLAVVQPGVIVQDLALALEEQGLFYAPDPASSGIATVGGTIATNAGGLRCIKYGVTSDAVRSLEVVLADGSVINTRRDTIKSVSGLDITSLIVGSEGTLGIVTQATLKVLTLPAAARAVSAMFQSLDAAIDAANTIATGKQPPATLEILDGVALRAIRNFDPTLRVPEGAEAWLLAVTDSHSGAQAELDEFEKICKANGASHLERTLTRDEFARVLKIRQALHGGLKAVSGQVHNGDIGVPRARLHDAVRRIRKISEEHDVVISISGHVGDGNLHPLIAFNPENKAETQRAHAAHEALLAMAGDLGGTITGEHGVGLEKLAALDGEISPRVRELQRAIKAAFDPKNIFNPGRKL